MNEAALNSSLSTILVLNRDFHMTLYAASESAPLVRTIDSLWLQAGPLLNAFQLESRRAEAARNQHQAILDALAAKNPNAARQALEEDLSLGLECILATLAPASGSGDGRCDP
jgi:DNA-binding GntR family transcriptional regulator